MNIERRKGKRQTGSDSRTETNEAAGKHNTDTNRHLKYQRFGVLIKARTNGP